jgi:hypothetical protein
MRVRCERFISTLGNRTGFETEAGPGGLTRGNEYLVLSLVVDPDPERGILFARFLVLNDDRSPTWEPTAMFSVTDGTVASNWESHTSQQGELELGPSAWLRDDFWTHYYGEDSERIARAHEVFRQELAVMEEEDTHGAHTDR